jgi:hypothetical protein
MIQCLSSLILKTALRGNTTLQYSHFTDEETEAQKDELTCLRLLGQQGSKPVFELGLRSFILSLYPPQVLS